MINTFSHLPPGAAEFKAPRDFYPPTEIIELDFNQVKSEIENYNGEGFENVEKVEDLSLVEYLQHLKADRGRYLGNIVHQGVRDHRGMADHTAGLGQYDRELELIVENGSLISSIGKVLNNKPKLAEAAEKIRANLVAGIPPQKAVEDFLFSDYEAGTDRLQGITDALAVHVSTNYIIDAHYGAETGNESFLVFPEKIGLKGKVFFGRAINTHASRATQYNDVYIWPQGEEPNDLKINGAMLFLSRDNKVSPNTGSVYEVENEAAVLDTEKIDQNQVGLAVDKENILGKVREADRGIFKKILNKFLVTERYSDAGLPFQAFFNPSEFKPEYLPKYLDALKQMGFDPDELERLCAINDNRQVVNEFFTKYSNYYNVVAVRSYGSYYKRPEKTMLSKDYYHQFICKRLKNIKVVSVSAGKQDIVEYRGINDKGESEIIRVVFYSNPDPNKAVEGFYEDLSIDFDKTILGQDGVGSVDFDNVSYNYEYNKLKQKLIELVGV